MCIRDSLPVIAGALVLPLEERVIAVRLADDRDGVVIGRVVDPIDRRARLGLRRAHEPDPDAAGREPDDHDRGAEPSEPNPSSQVSPRSPACHRPAGWRDRTAWAW